MEEYRRLTDVERESLLNTAYKYCRLRLLPFGELGYEETCEYGIRRSRLHDGIARLVDADRELVEKAFTKAVTKFGFESKDGIIIDGSCKDDFDFNGAFDAFCKELDELLYSTDEERHPDELTKEKLDKMNLDINGIPNLTNGE
jgi:hypothetical protein